MKTYRNPISTAMSEYREDFRYNREWWTERMGVGNNNEYLWIQFKNGDSITVQADYFQYDGNSCLPRFRADEVAYISRYFGDQVETTTAADIVVDTDRVILYRKGVECFRYEMTESEFKEMRRQMWELEEGTDATAWMLGYCRALAISKMNDQPEPTNPDNTPTTMNATATTAPEFSELSHAVNDNREYIAKLRRELQEYKDNASKGGQNRRRNMILLRWDIRKLERRLSANTARTKSINDIMNQANRLMSVCSAARNFKRADAICEIAYRYYDNIRACVGAFNYNDDSEYSKEYSRAQYMAV